MAKEALGMIETYGYIGAVEAADVCVKSANVKLLGCEFVKGGLVTIHITGDVGAVKAAIDAAESAVKKFGSLISSHVIPRPGEGIEKMLPKAPEPDNDNKDEDDSSESEETEEIKEVDNDISQEEEAGINDNDSKEQVQNEQENQEVQVVQNEQQETEVESQDSKEESSNKKEKTKLSVDINSAEELKQIKTVELRAIARELDDKFSEYFPIERSQIKYSKKDELINAILTFYERVK